MIIEDISPKTKAELNAEEGSALRKKAHESSKSSKEGKKSEQKDASLQPNEPTQTSSPTGEIEVQIDDRELNSPQSTGKVLKVDEISSTNGDSKLFQENPEPLSQKVLHNIHPFLQKFESNGIKSSNPEDLEFGHGRVHENSEILRPNPTDPSFQQSSLNTMPFSSVFEPLQRNNNDKNYEESNYLAQSTLKSFISHVVSDVLFSFDYFFIFPSTLSSHLILPQSPSFL